MADVTITNLTTSPLYIGDLYTTIPASGSIVVNRYASDLSRMQALQAEIAAGNAAVSVALTTAEASSGLTAADGSVQARDVAPVAATDVAAAEVVLRKPFTSVASTDTVVFAANALPYKMRVVDAYLLISTVQAGSSVQLWSQAAGGGAAITASASTAVAGRIQASLTGDASVVLTPGALVGMFLLPSAHSGIVGELVVTVRRES